MKKSTKLFASAVAAVALLISTNVSAQKIGFGANLGIPTDGAYSFAAGIDARIQFDVTKQLSVPVATGYTNFFAKDRSYFNGAAIVDVPDYGYIPVKTGLKYFLDPTGSGVYAMAEVGAAFGVTDNAKTTFLYAPTIGYSWSNGLDLGLKYENTGKGDALRLVDDKNRTGQIALRIAYGFKL
ncbi:hypothetical protein [Pedobacter hartonius]|uniref:Outer membrane protein beta-barrel domain-containing protein n=1 Tax=Pedobacter hartonius TaxID=425514 RepID=A0A1H4HEV4_9SPHI|nr:hypothetical protein [Pedobacter hartonius]SEB20156.1 hypothetical protein SAMN05443550_11649 [Pedobacter hartonius]